MRVNPIIGAYHVNNQIKRKLFRAKANSDGNGKREKDEKVEQVLSKVGAVDLVV